MHKIGVIGDKDSVLGFKAVGFDVFAAQNSEEAAKILKEKAGLGYAVIYITEQAAAGAIDAIDAYKESKLPAIIPIPGNAGALGLGMASVKKSVERAVGADILFDK
ncbi:MAG: V-type ATP synthase subunit F [Clostridiales bacterium]|jgi:V/A-type H+-transporting ATPase subunit F|nr:V-type ATP synthase subunit F [Clostridiales bacterium]